MSNIVELMKQEIINRSNKFEEETKDTKDEYNLFREHVQYVHKYATMIAKEKRRYLISFFCFPNCSRSTFIFSCVHTAYTMSSALISS